MTTILVVSTVSISHLSGPKNCIILYGGSESTGHVVQGCSNYSGQVYSSLRLQGHMWRHVKKTLCKSGLKSFGKWSCVVPKTKGNCSSNSTARHPRRHEPWTTSLRRIDILYSLGVFFSWKFICSLLKRGTRWRSWLRHYVTNRNFAGSIPNEVIGIFHWLTFSGHVWSWGWLNLQQKWVREMSTGD
jgi:hypothetical protein